MSDDNVQLFSARVPIFPKRVSGNFRNLKWVLMAIMLGIYYILPWIRWDRGESLPGQAVLLDLSDRRFFFFWIEIWPHEFYFVAGLLIMAGLGLFLFTSALGRVWCGYACPQTVWTDLFILVERWIEGDRNARVRLHEQKWSFYKLRLRLAKWSVWLLIGLLTGGAWVFYFTDAPTLFEQLLNFEAPLIAYVTILILTTTTFVFGGFAREQICIYACPWPRIQAAMMDEETLTIGYRHWRGEPRGKHRKVEGNENLGDCIDCMACVNVCPMGVDIRDGQQLACITCGLCIDACDDVMDKIGKPRGLIDYMALSDEVLEANGKPPRSVWSHIFRIRTIFYTFLWGGVGIALLFALFIRQDIDLTVSPVRNPTFITLSNGDVRNIYEVGIRNKSPENRFYDFSITGDEGDLLRIDRDTKNGGLFEVKANETGKFRLLITAPKGSPAALSHSSEFRIWVYDYETGEKSYKDTVFNGNKIKE